jgi:hypothetical protein
MLIIDKQKIPIVFKYGLLQKWFHSSDIFDNVK